MTTTTGNQHDTEVSGAISPSAVTFFMVGCQRCGTTWVDAALREHPEVFLPRQKQTYFFDRNYDKGLAWYLENFRQAEPSQRAVGEVATGYCLPHAIPLMARDFPHAKLIMTMRHPVDRAYSFYLTRKAEFEWESFEQALEAEPEILARGRYIEQIEALLDHYPREQLLLLLYEDLSRNDRAYLRRILEFLEVDPDFESSQFGKQRNSSMFPRLRRVLNALGLRSVLRRLSKSIVGDGIRAAKKKWGGSSARSMNSMTRRRLLEEYRPYNDRLAEFLGRDLSHWNR